VNLGWSNVSSAVQSDKVAGVNDQSSVNEAKDSAI
jgi:hypothetical protein